MISRRFFKAGSVLLAGVLTLLGTAEGYAYGAQTVPQVSQSAAWVNQQEYRGEIIVNITGLETYFSQGATGQGEPQPAELGALESSPSPEAEVLNEETEGEEAAEELFRADAETAALSQMPAEKESEAERAATDEEGLETPPDEAAIEAALEEAFPKTALAEETAPAEGIAAVSPEEAAATPSLVYYLSQYFVLDSGQCPYSTEETVLLDKNAHPVTVTKITIPLLKENPMDQNSPGAGTIGETMAAVIRLPILLREEYRGIAEGHAYPVSQEIPSMEAQTPGIHPGEGLYLIDNSGQLLAQGGSAFLETAPKEAEKADFTVSLVPDDLTPKAGSALSYRAVLVNTGTLPLTEIRLSPALAPGTLTAQWEMAEGLSLSENGQAAVLSVLDPGEQRELCLLVKLPEEQQEPVSNTLTVLCQNPTSPGQTITKEVRTRTTVVPLKADFTVEKTADRTSACPGDTIIYQICIRNTGERTLHSVISTERFLSADIQARFLEREGVELNPAKNQALVPQIKPGEAFALQAAVTLPLELSSQQLINEVTVVSRETGARSIRSQAGVQVQAAFASPTPTPWPLQKTYQSGLSKTGGSSSKPVSSYPKTEDEAPAFFWTGVLLLSAGVCTGAFCARKGKRKH